MVRWIAIIGQVIALIVAQRVFQLELEYGLCYLAVGVSVIGNLIAMFVFPENKLLSETENTFMILFDLLQLSFLLFHLPKCPDNLTVCGKSTNVWKILLSTKRFSNHVYKQVHCQVLQVFVWNQQ